MSSPAVLTWEKAPLEDALRANTQFAEELLARCRETLKKLQARSGEIAARGGNVPPPAIESLEQVEQRMRSLLTLQDSPRGLELIHAYYLRLKHPWIERMDEAEEDLERQQAERAERAQIAADTGISAELVRAARERALSAISGPIRTKHREVQSAGDANAGTEIETEALLLKRLAEELRVLGAGNNRLQEAETQIANCAAAPVKLALARIQAAIVAEGAITQQRLNEAATARAEARRREQAREEITIGIKCAEKILDSLPEVLAAQYLARFKEVLDGLDAGSPQAAIKEYEVIHKAMQDASAAGKSAHALIAALTKLGYKAVSAMELIKAEDFMEVDLKVPGEEERFVEIRWNPKQGALGTEVVRASETTGSPAQQSADLKAQKKVCADLEAVMRELKSAHGFKMAIQTEPGAKVKYRSRDKFKRNKTAIGKEISRSA